ncbi:MAG: putative bacteriophage-related protein [Hyphomicrobiales bacterium]|nr:putative bacteriophage-related protein [Hyphomicrobiales bacterium]
MPRDYPAAIEDEIGQLRGLDLESLRARWRTLTGRRVAAHVPKSLLLRMLAYRMQANLFGDLDAATIRFLDRVATDRSLQGTGSLPQPDSDRVRAGALLVREWEGVSHRVTALAEGYAWNGTTYRSLSEVARAITGTRWNGPRFFGLRDRASRS